MPRAPSRSTARRALRATSIGLAALLAAVVPTDAAAAPSPGKQFEGKGGRFGLGLSLGDPMGASAKLFLHPNHAVQFDLGWAPMHHGIGTLGADYLWHPATFVSNSVLDFLPYLGFGVKLGFWARYCYGGGHGRYRGCGRGGAAMLLRIPALGLAIHWKQAPLDTVLEGAWSPFIVLPDLPHGDVSFKIRYYF